jgi:ATP phosphoribosyltransferase regulatory subunit
MTVDAVDNVSQKAAIAKTFSMKGYMPIEPNVIQPAEPFLDLSGEDIRSRIYMFTDPFGRELCLRPDLTIPTCLHYLEDRKTGVIKKYAYEGVAFRCQDSKSTKPNEFSQSGIELIGEETGPGLDSQIIALTIEACRSAGVKAIDLMMGDLGLFAAFIEALDIPQHWRERLRRSFWQPSHFGALLASLCEKKGKLEGAVAVLAKQGNEGALETVSGLLDLAGLDAVPGRSIENVTKRLMEKAKDAAAEPVSEDMIACIEDYLKIAGAPIDCLKEIEKLARDHKINIDPAMADASLRFEALGEIFEGLANVTFATEFGRGFEYYTGFVFELTSRYSVDGQIAGGGRYDDLLLRLGADSRVPAVGAMIRNDRLAEVIAKEGGAP